LEEEVKKELERLYKEIDILRDCLIVTRPVVEDYYHKKNLEVLRGYE